MVKEIKWDLFKNEQLKIKRGASFEDILNNGKLISVKKHPKKKNQNIMLFDLKKYIWVVPYIEEKDGTMFLKTLYPSRKYTRIIKGEIS